LQKRNAKTQSKTGKAQRVNLRIFLFLKLKPKNRVLTLPFSPGILFGLVQDSTSNNKASLRLSL
jgi:hypothetical protein